MKNKFFTAPNMYDKLINEIVEISQKKKSMADQVIILEHSESTSNDDSEDEDRMYYI